MIKRIELVVMDRENRKVIRRFKIKPPVRQCRNFKTRAEWTQKTSFSEEGAEEALRSLVGQIDEANPNHRYRLVAVGGWRFKLVWEAARQSPEEMAASEAFAEMVMK